MANQLFSYCTVLVFRSSTANVIHNIYVGFDHPSLYKDRKRLRYHRKQSQFRFINENDSFSVTREIQYSCLFRQDVREAWGEGCCIRAQGCKVGHVSVGATVVLVYIYIYVVIYKCLRKNIKPLLGLVVLSLKTGVCCPQAPQKGGWREGSSKLMLRRCKQCCYCSSFLEALVT